MKLGPVAKNNCSSRGRDGYNFGAVHKWFSHYQLFKHITAQCYTNNNLIMDEVKCYIGADTRSDI